MAPSASIAGFSNKRDVEEYCCCSLKRYHYWDLASATLDAYLAYHIIYTDVSGRSQAMIGAFAWAFRLHYSIKVFLHLFALPFFAFGGTFGKLNILLSSSRTYDMVAPKDITGYKAKGDKLLMALNSKTVLWYNHKEKAIIWSKIFGIVYFTALLLVLDHDIYRLLDIALMSVWICVGSFASYLHFIFFPSSFSFVDKVDNRDVIQPSKIGCLVLLYTVSMVAGWSFGNYIAVLDWDEPCIFFPNGNYIGISLGHFLAALVGTICVNI